MSFFFSGLRTPYEKIHFVDKLLLVIKEALLHSETVPMQIAALYLYYAVYNKQPLQRFSRIRITLSESDKLLAFTKSLNNRPQPLTILSRLWSEGAFMLVADSEEVLKIARKTSSYREECKPQEQAFKTLNLRMDMEDLFDEEEGLLGRMEMLEVAYNEMKEDLGGQGDNQLASTMTCDAIRKQLDKIQDLLVTNTAFPGPSNDQLQAPTKSTRRNRVLEKISAIQRSKNTLPLDEPGPSPKKFKSNPEVIVIEDEDSINIDTSFLYCNTYPRPPSLAVRLMKKVAPESGTEEEEEKEEAIPVKGRPRRQRKKMTTTATVTARKTKQKREKKK